MPPTPAGASPHRALPPCSAPRPCVSAIIDGLRISTNERLVRRGIAFSAVSRVRVRSYVEHFSAPRSLSRRKAPKAWIFVVFSLNTKSQHRQRSKVFALRTSVFALRVIFLLFYIQLCRKICWANMLYNYTRYQQRKSLFRMNLSRMMLDVYDCPWSCYRYRYTVQGGVHQTAAGRGHGAGRAASCTEYTTALPFVRLSVSRVAAGPHPSVIQQPFASTQKASPAERPAARSRYHRLPSCAPPKPTGNVPWSSR